MKLSQKVKSFNEFRYGVKFKSSPGTDLRIKKILDLIGSNKKILDIGCYDGTIAHLLQMHGNIVTGVDISTTAVSQAKRKGIKAYVGNFEESAFSYLGTFDTILAGEIIEHIFDPDSFLQNVSSHLITGGHLIITTPNLGALGSRVSLLLGKLPWMIENDLLPGKSGHIRYFTFSELDKLLRRHNFVPSIGTTDAVSIGPARIPLIDQWMPSLGRILIVDSIKK